jgi:hypothetical protein
MGARAQELIERFQQVNDEMLSIAESCSPAEWVSICPAEGWTVAAVVRHVAAAYPLQVEVIRRFAAGEPIPETHTDWSSINRSNARFAEQFADTDREETLTLLKRNVADVHTFLVRMTDDDLDHTAYFPLMKETRTTQTMIERILLGHPEEHLISLRATVSEIK